MWFLHHLAAKALLRLARTFHKGVSDMPKKTRTPSEHPIITTPLVTPATAATAATAATPVNTPTSLQESPMSNETVETIETIDTIKTIENVVPESIAAPVLTADERKARLLIAETRVRDHMMVSLGVGLLPFPLLDLAAAVGTQVTLVKRLCDLYEVPFSESRTRGIVTSLFGTLGVAGSALIIGASLSKLIPGSGTALGMLSLPLMSAAYTYAIGQIFIGHFEIGGGLADFESQKYSSYFQELYKRGKENAASLMPAKKSTAPAAPATQATTELAEPTPHAEPQAQAS
jgi:uncharacterized protein (DUF697 family)